MLRKTLVLTVALAAVSLVMLSCDSNESQQNRSVLSIESLISTSDGLAAPVVSDVLTNGSVFPDQVTVVFQNRPYSQLITTAPDRPYGDFEIYKYTVEWVSTDGSTPALPTYEADMGLTVPTFKSAAATVIIITWENKANPPLDALVGANQEARMNAKITFFGHETGTARETTVQAQIGVIFADFADPAP
jgi:hypothetical protein